VLVSTSVAVSFERVCEVARDIVMLLPQKRGK